MHLEVRNVSLSFGDTPVLRNISCAIEPGVRLAVVGESGAGKSSLTKLFIRATDPTAGEILVNGVPLPQYQLWSVLRHIGVILQQSEMVSGDVRENVCLGLHQLDLAGVTDDMIWEVLDTISPSFRIRFKERGLDTMLGKQGLQLSGGELQRLCVARALIKKPEFLIIDEATASLDSETERVVQEGIDTALRGNLSALVVAHRFSTLRNCNRFMVLKNLAHCSPHESQIETICDSAAAAYELSPTFRRLADLQGFTP